MSAKDELRRMLDERGVEWGNIRKDGTESDFLTEWQLNDSRDYAVAIEWAVGGGLSVELLRHHLTPEQAIAATLGGEERTCKMNRVKMFPEYEDCIFECWECSACKRTNEEQSPSYCPNCGAKVVGE